MLTFRKHGAYQIFRFFSNEHINSIILCYYKDYDKQIHLQKIKFAVLFKELKARNKAY